MLLSIALIVLIVGTIVIERTSSKQKFSDSLVPVKVESKRDFHSQKNNRK